MSICNNSKEAIVFISPLEKGKRVCLALKQTSHLEASIGDKMFFKEVTYLRIEFEGCPNLKCHMVLSTARL